MSDVNPTPSADPVEAVKDPTNPLDGAKPKEESPVDPVVVEDPKEGNPDDPKDPEEKMVTVKALHEAKNENKELRKAVAQFEADKKAEADKTLAEQGKYEDLANQYKTENETLKEQLEGLKTNSDQFLSMLTAEVATYMAKIPDEANKVLVEQLLEGKSLLEKRKLMPQLVEKFGVPASVNPPIGGVEKTPTGDADKQAKYEQARKSGSVEDLLGLAPAKKIV